jgi:hypothetical protein
MDPRIQFITQTTSRCHKAVKCSGIFSINCEWHKGEPVNGLGERIDYGEGDAIARGMCSVLVAGIPRLGKAPNLTRNYSRLRSKIFPIQNKCLIS